MGTLPNGGCDVSNAVSAVANDAVPLAAQLAESALEAETRHKAVIADAARDVLQVACVNAQGHERVAGGADAADRPAPLPIRLVDHAEVEKRAQQSAAADSEVVETAEELSEPGSQQVVWAPCVDEDIC